MYEPALHAIGLTQGEAEIYEILLNLGPSPARAILKKTKLKRGNVYNILDALAAQGLISKKDEKGAKTIFTPNSPNALAELLAKKAEEARQGTQQLADILDNLKSLYALVQEKPAVRFFEGEEGIRKVLYDSLSAKDGIYTFADTEAVEQNVKQLNQGYVKKRLEMQISKKIIARDTPFSREHYKKAASPLTEIRFIPSSFKPFETGMQTYNDTVAYMTLREQKLIGVIIEDKSIAQMHKSLFEYIWSTLPPAPAAPAIPERSAPKASPSALV